MATSPEYLTFVLDQLREVPEVTVRAMFGGSGIYSEGLMFALIAYDILYFKADAGNRQAFQDEGAVPFVFETKARTVATSYYSVPEDRLEDPERLREWAFLAIGAARRAAAKKRKG